VEVGFGKRIQIPFADSEILCHVGIEMNFVSPYYCVRLKAAFSTFSLFRKRQSDEPGSSALRFSTVSEQRTKTTNGEKKAREPAAAVHYYIDDNTKDGAVVN